MWLGQVRRQGLATERLGAVAVLPIDSLGYAAGGVSSLTTPATEAATRPGRKEPSTP